MVFAAGIVGTGLLAIPALYAAAILNGLAAPPLILLTLILGASRHGGVRRSGRWSLALVGAAFLVMSACAVVYLIGLVT